jgi:hypothetical protein
MRGVGAGAADTSASIIVLPSGEWAATTPRPSLCLESWPEPPPGRVTQFAIVSRAQRKGNMSPSVDDAQAQWLGQLAAMRKAIADLHLPVESQKPPAYGDDIEFDDDDFSGTASGEDIWDIISDEYEDEYSSDHLEQFSDLPTRGSIYSQQWLAEKCANIAQRSSGLDAEALKEQISAILASDSNGKIIEAAPNLWFPYIDFVQTKSSR